MMSKPTSPSCLRSASSRRRFEISHHADTNTNNVVDASDVQTRIIVFTDKEQASAPVAGSNVSITNADPVAGRINLPAAATDLSTITSYDHDGDGMSPLTTASVACPDGVQCSFTIADGKVTAISGYKITASGAIAPVASMEDETYLAFGVWLQETLVDGLNTYQFGAFADGGSPYDESTGNNGGTAAVAEIVGTATYNGSAAGVKSTASGSDFFTAAATLTANFGAPGTAADANVADDEMGYISGRIHNIMVGGESMADAIYLDAVDNTPDDPGTPSSLGTQSIETNGEFDGRARMGAATTDPNTGVVTYPYNGTWQGEFYNQVQNDADTTANEALMPPMSAAGTFGVTRPDDMTTMNVNEQASYVGAFGAHRDE